MKQKEQNLKNLTPFNIEALDDFNFGLADGEKDETLKDTFILTKSVRKLLKHKYNYVLSPKGAGKSATFKALNEKYIASKFINYEKYHFLAINEAFETNNEYLSTKRFKSNLEHKKYTISWALYIVMKLIKIIIRDYKTLPSYNKFENEIKKYGDFKDEYELYNILDYLERINLSMKFTSNGQDLFVNPSVTIKKNRKKISLNEIYKLIDNFFNENGIVIKILIDRVDNFVQKEEYQIQKNYLQGLIDCVEELATLKNIEPLVFLRTDLFLSHSLNFEHDKVADRIIYLEWSKDEILHFITKRLFTNKYIRENYESYFGYIVQNELNTKVDISEKPKLIKVINKIFRKKNSFDLNTNLDYKITERFIKLFFSNEIEYLNCNQKTEKTDFCNWIFMHFIDTNNFINPRLILRFLQILFDKQHEVYHTHNILDSKFIKIKEIAGFHTYNLFMCDVIKSVYKQVQNEQLKTIFKLQNTKITQALFRKINELTTLKNEFKYGDINLKNYDTDKDEYSRLLKYLTLLGYLKKVDTQKYVTSPLYKKELELSI